MHSACSPVQTMVKTTEAGWLSGKFEFSRSAAHCCTGAHRSWLQCITGSASSLHLKEKVKPQKPHAPQANSPHVPANTPT